MESSSQIIGVTEECNSSESGWTMYLASPMHDDDDGVGDSGEEDGVGSGGYGDDDSDDSMASDASSGPCHRERSYKNTDQGHCMGHSKHHHDDDDGEEDYGYSYTKVSKQKEKMKDEEKRNEREKEGPLHVDRNSSLVCSSSKEEMNGEALKVSLMNYRGTPDANGCFHMHGSYECPQA